MVYKNKKIRLGWLLVLLVFLGIVCLLTLTPYMGEYTYEKNYNLIPFKSIINYYYSFKYNGLNNGKNGIVAFLNLAGNMLLLTPFGFILPLTFPGRIDAKKVFYSSFFITLSIEIIQFLYLTSRRADIDDIIFNTLGALIGYLIYKIICFKHYKMYKNNPPGKNTKYFKD